MNKKFIRLRLSQLNNIEIKNDVEIVKYDSKSHHSLIPTLYSMGFNDAPWTNDWDNIKEFDANGVFLLRCKITKKYLGFAISFNRNDFGYISVVTILPEYRNNGYAKVLIKSCIEYLKSTGMQKIMIDVKADNSSALGLYKKLGFVEYKND